MTFVPIEPRLPQGQGEPALIRQLTDLWRGLATTVNGHSAALGTGVIADRPATPDVPGGTVAFWYATDTSALSVWDGTAWDAVGGGGSITNWTEGLNTSAPNATIPVATFTATNAATNVDAAILPKGSGSILADVPDNTAAGGNKRGTNAVDLQLQRGGASQVASGNNSSQLGGVSNTASAQYATTLGGNLNIASGQFSIAGGDGSVASGDYSVALGGGSTAASGSNSLGLVRGTANAASAIAIGVGANNNSVVGGWSDSGIANYPRQRYTLTNSTTSATPVVLTTNLAAAAATNQVYMGTANNRSGIYRGLVVARQTGNGGAKKSWEFVAHLDRDNGTVALVAAVTPVVVADSGVGWSVAVTADNTLKTLKVEVTGAAATTIRWACYIDGQECQGT